MLYVVTGPPCVGKSTWVRERAKPGEIVVDLDRLALAITAENTPHHSYPGHVRKTAVTMRKVAIQAALNYCRPQDAYIVHSKPSARARHHYSLRGATFIELTAPQDVLLARAQAERPGHIVELVRRWAAEPDDDL